MYGSYGVVHFKGPHAFKRTRLFERLGNPGTYRLDAGNLNEAVMSMSSRKLPNVTSAESVAMTTSQRNVEIKMEKGEMSLREYVHTTPTKQRLAQSEFILRELAVAIRHMHVNGMVHCDLKPLNIVVNLTDSGDIKSLKLIDFGSLRLFKRNNSAKTVGTIEFMAPEVFTDKCSTPNPLHDAFSLGAIMRYFIFKKNLFYRDDCRGCDFYKQWHPVYTYVNGVPESVTTSMYMLLQKNPSDRMSIKELVDVMNPDGAGIVPKLIIKDGDYKYAKRNEVIDGIFDAVDKEHYHSMETAPLVINILDRFKARKRSARIDSKMIRTCMVLAYAIMFPDKNIYVTRSIRKRAINVLEVLDFDLYTDTVDMVLKVEYGVDNIDPVLLKGIMKENLNCHDAAVCYMAAIRA